MTGDDLYTPGLRLREPQPATHTRPQQTSWWTVAETGEQFTAAAAQAATMRQRDRRGIKTPDREWYR